MQKPGHLLFTYENTLPTSAQAPRLHFRKLFIGAAQQANRVHALHACINAGATISA
jgi:hypothetical protein